MHISEREPSQFVPERVVASFEHPSVPFQPRPAYAIGPDIRSEGEKDPSLVELPNWFNSTHSCLRTSGKRCFLIRMKGRNLPQPRTRSQAEGDPTYVVRNRAAYSHRNDLHSMIYFLKICIKIMSLYSQAFTALVPCSRVP